MTHPQSYLLIDLIAPLSNELISLAHQVQCLAPSHNNPHSFHEGKSEIVNRLRVLARGIPPSKDGKGGAYRPVWTKNVQLVPHMGLLSYEKRRFEAGKVTAIVTDKIQNKKLDKKHSGE